MASEREIPPYESRAAGWSAAALLALLTLFILDHLAWPRLIADTTTAGGDTPAHLYIASRLREALFQEGRLVCWAPGWWCGFPLFRYYFPLPYLVMVLLAQAMPFNVAFKLASVAGLLLLPLCGWLAGRWMRLPRPAPLLLAAACVPFLFVRTHSMWGANIASTLAGMIANSYGFPLMLLAVASGFRDAEDGRIRARTPLLLAVTVSAHFFTAVMAGLTLAAVPLLLARTRGLGRTVRLLALEGGLALLMTAGWWMPLAARRGFSTDFGAAWPVSLWNTLPPYALWLAPLAVAAPFLALRRRVRAVGLFAAMGAGALLLFAKGAALSPVFVNVRLWPFLYFAWLALAACGAGLLLAGRRGHGLLAGALALAGLALVERGETADSWAVRPGVEAAPPSRACADWNYEGLERKPRWALFRDLLEPLRHTPGRLANELNPAHTVFGSVRICEAVPHLFQKPVLEGGLVNSAVGALFAYYVQGESSLEAAGFPERVTPGTFDPARASRHFDLFRVSHFLVASEPVRAGFAALPGWRIRAEAEGWSLFERIGFDGRLVAIPAVQPVGVRTRNWKRCALAWLATIEAIGQPFAFLDPDQAGRFPGPVIDEAAFDRYLAAVRDGRDPAAAGLPPVFGAPTAPGSVREEPEAADGRIRFFTDAPGQPHLVAATYDPNWRSDAGPVFLATPGFRLLYPDRHEVTLTFGRGGWEWAGLALAGLGWLGWLGLAWRQRPRGTASAGRAAALKLLDASLGLVLCRLAALRPFGRSGGGAPPSRPLERILVIRPGGMGDMVLLIPALRRLIETHPRAAVDLVCERRNRGILRLAGLPVEVLEADTAPLFVLLRLWRRRYDAAVDTEQFHHLSALAALASGAPVRIGFKVNPARNPLYTRLVTYDMDGPEGEQFMRLFEPLGVRGPAPALAGCLEPDPAAVRSWVRDAIAAASADGLLAALHPGGTHASKRWDEARFAELIRRWLAADPRARVVLVGGPADRAAARRVRRLATGAGGRLVDCCGRTSLVETAWVLAQSRVFVGGDSGVAHLAAAVGSATVVLFGSGDPRKWGARGPGHRVVRLNLPCSPCALFGYQRSCRDPACLSGLSVETVWAVLQDWCAAPDRS